MTDFDFEVGAPIAPTAFPAEVPAGPGSQVERATDELSEDVGPPLRPADPPFDPEPVRERVRSVLAIVLVGWCLVLMVSIAIAVLAVGADIAIAKELTTLLLTPSIALASAVTGFYFASRR